MSTGKESHRQMLDRLAKEGRLEAFNARVAELKGGCDTKEERQAAWAQAVVEFKQPVSSNGYADPDPDLADPAVFAGKTAPLRENLDWVGRNLVLRGIKPEDAPSPEAWGLLRWVRRDPGNEDLFWKNLMLAPAGPASKDRSGNGGTATQELPDALAHFVEIEEFGKREALRRDAELRAEVKAELRRELAASVREELANCSSASTATKGRSCRSAPQVP